MRFLKSHCLLVILAIFGLVPGALAQSNSLPEISAIDATNYLNQQVIVTDKVVGVALRRLEKDLDNERREEVIEDLGKELRKS